MNCPDNGRHPPDYVPRKYSWYLLPAVKEAYLAVVQQRYLKRRRTWLAIVDGRAKEGCRHSGLIGFPMTQSRERAAQGVGTDRVGVVGNTARA